MKPEENMSYQKLFNVKYNNKVFTIFIDKYGRRTFLEVTATGNLIYPYIDDFIALNKIYNERNNFISNVTNHTYSVGSKLPIHRDRNFTFKEFVRLSTGSVALSLAILTGTSMLSSLHTNRMFRIAENNGQLEVVVDYVDGALINNTNELDTILGYTSASKDDVITAINSNDNISNRYKQYAINLINFIQNKYPNTDVRIFYENMKDVIVRDVANGSLGKYTAGNYNSYDNIISICEDYKESEQVITHEFAHAYHHWKEDKDLLPKYRNESQGHALDEAMTNKIINGIVPTTTYHQEGKVLDYFLTCVNYDYYDYETEGISKLIKLLKEKYPTVDIDYIINAIDSMNDTYFSIGQDIKIEDNPQVLDEFFNICICNAEQKTYNRYQPFIDFLKLIDYRKVPELAEQYLNEYNNYLISSNYGEENIHSDVYEFIRPLTNFKNEETRFRSHLKNLDISTVSKENLYQPFKDFINSFGHYQCLSPEETNKFYCNLLDTYNDYLYCNGYTIADTITSSSMIESISKYNNVRIIGYDITKDDVLYPVVKIEGEKLPYNEDTRVATLNEQGQIILIDKNDIAKSARTSDNLYQSQFIKTFFTNLGQDKIEFNEVYWQDLFKMSPFDYKKYSFYANGEEITQNYLQDMYVLIGQKTDGTNTFALKSENQIIYQDDNNIEGVSVPLKYYLDEYLNSTDSTLVELTDFLNKDYLKRLIAGEDLSSSINPFHSNFTYDKENDIVKVHPVYYLVLSEEERKILLNSVFLDVYPNEINLVINGESKNVEEVIEENNETSDRVYLETVLDYYGILSEDQQEYQFSEPEILELYNNYYKDNINKNDTNNNQNTDTNATGKTR